MPAVVQSDILWSGPVGLGTLWCIQANFFFFFRYCRSWHLIRTYTDLQYRTALVQISFAVLLREVNVYLIMIPEITAFTSEKYFWETEGLIWRVDWVHHPPPVSQPLPIHQSRRHDEWRNHLASYVSSHISTEKLSLRKQVLTRVA